MKKYTCPCCGYMTLTEEPPGTFDICKICFWEDDPVQFSDPTYSGGANDVSLITAQQNYEKVGAYEGRFMKDVRKPYSKEDRDPNWKTINIDNL